MSSAAWATDPHPRALLINGTVGVGKTTTADAIGRLLAAAGTPHAVLDMDALRQAWPAPAEDPFQVELALVNLSAVASNCVAAGSRRLVLAGVVETRTERDRYQQALQMPLTLVRLRVDATSVRERLVRRHPDDEAARDWHLARLGQLAAILEEAAIDDHVIDVAGSSPDEVAAAVLRSAG